LFNIVDIVDIVKIPNYPA